MANVRTYGIKSTSVQEVISTVKFTAAADVAADGYTVNDNPANVVSTVARASEGTITITLAQKWAGLSNVLVSCSTDDFTFTLDSETVNTTKAITLTCRKQSADASADTDPDAAVIRVTLVLRLQ